MVDWKKLVGLGNGSNPERNPVKPTTSDAVPQRKGLAARAEENTAQYREAIGLLQQLVIAGLEHLGKESDLQIRVPGMVDMVAEPARYKTSTSNGAVIIARVPGKNEAKELQRMVREALSLPKEDGQNYLQRQQGNRKNEGGEPTYKIFLPVCEYRDGKFIEGVCKTGDGHTIKRLDPKEAVIVLKAVLSHMHIAPDAARYYERTDREANRATSEEERQLRDAMRKAEETGDSKTDAEKRAAGRIRLDGLGGGLGR